MPDVHTTLLPAGPDPLARIGYRTSRHADGNVLGEQSGWFLTGRENRIVRTAAETLLAAPNDDARLVDAQRMSPITLIGPPGCGKSLLATAVANQASVAWGAQAVMHTSLPDFRRMADAALSDDRVAAFRRRMRGLRLLVLEELHRCGSSQWMADELVATIDALRGAGAIVLITSLTSPAGIATLGPPLLSRLSEGLSVEVSPADEPVRGELLRRCVEANGKPINEDALGEITSHVSGDARRLMATARQLCELAPPARPVSRTEVREWIRRGTPAESTPLHTIAKLVAKRFGQPLRELRSPSRRQPVVAARAAAITLARRLTPLSYDEIGRYFGGRDHTTVAHSHNAANRRAAADRGYREALDSLIAELRSKASA
ncbi:MAG: DnaA/Hda family protein [Planctomycetota bacterium]